MWIFPFVFARIQFFQSHGFGSFYENRLSVTDWMMIQINFHNKIRRNGVKNKEIVFFFKMKSSGHYSLHHTHNSRLVLPSAHPCKYEIACLKCEMPCTTTLFTHSLIHRALTYALMVFGYADLDSWLLMLLLWVLLCCRRRYFAFFGFCWSLCLYCV